MSIVIVPQHDVAGEPHPVGKLASTGVLYGGMEALGGGSVLAGMVLGAIAVFIIDGKLQTAAGWALAGAILATYSVRKLFSGDWVLDFRHVSWKPDWDIIRALFRFGLPTGLQGIAMNIAGVALLRFVGSTASSAEAQAAYAIGYTELFSLVTWTSVGLMGAASAVAGQALYNF